MDDVICRMKSGERIEIFDLDFQKALNLTNVSHLDRKLMVNSWKEHSLQSIPFRLRVMEPLSGRVAIERDATGACSRTTALSEISQQHSQ